MLLNLEIILQPGTYSVFLTPGSVESVEIEPRGTQGVIRMKSGREYVTSSENCGKALAWLGWETPGLEAQK